MKSNTAWIPGLTTEDKKRITSGGWLSDEIVDAGQQLLKSMYPHIYKGFKRLHWVWSCHIALQKVSSSDYEHWKTPLGNGFKH